MIFLIRCSKYAKNALYCLNKTKKKKIKWKERNYTRFFGESDCHLEKQKELSFYLSSPSFSFLLLLLRRAFTEIVLLLPLKYNFRLLVYTQKV